MDRYKSNPATPELIDKTTGNSLPQDEDPVDPENCNASFYEHGLDPYKINGGGDGDNRP